MRDVLVVPLTAPAIRLRGKRREMQRKFIHLMINNFIFVCLLQILSIPLKTPWLNSAPSSRITTRTISPWFLQLPWFANHLRQCQRNLSISLRFGIIHIIIVVKLNFNKLPDNSPNKIQNKNNKFGEIQSKTLELLHKQWGKWDEVLDTDALIHWNNIWRELEWR